MVYMDLLTAVLDSYTNDTRTSLCRMKRQLERFKGLETYLMPQASNLPYPVVEGLFTILLVSSSSRHGSVHLLPQSLLSFGLSLNSCAFFNNAYIVCNLGISSPFSLASLIGFPRITSNSIFAPFSQSPHILGRLPLLFFFVEFKIASAVASLEGKGLPSTFGAVSKTSFMMPVSIIDISGSRDIS